MDSLPGVLNKYGGLYLASEDMPADPASFRERLAFSLERWAGEGIPVVWLSLSRDRVDHIPHACKCGFSYHHCTADMLMLIYRLEPTAVVPPYASRTIGVGGVVLSPAGALLTVLEKTEAHVRPQYWKLPGGMLEPGEHIADGVTREVREETGIETRFEGVLGLRHHHRGQFGTSNIYFICKLTPLTEAITTDHSELTRAVWMPVQDYLDNAHIGVLNRRAVQAALSAGPLAGVKLEGYMGGPEAYEIFLPGSG